MFIDVLAHLQSTSEKEYDGTKIGRVENIISIKWAFASESQRKRFGTWKDQSQPVRAQADSLPVVVNAVIRGGRPLHFQRGVPQATFQV